MRACNRNIRRGTRCARCRRGDVTVITDKRDCGYAPETLDEELYNVPNEDILMLKCCDSTRGCREIDARRRCTFWPGFAHPRWLTCRELNNRRI